MLRDRGTALLTTSAEPLIHFYMAISMWKPDRHTLLNIQIPLQIQLPLCTSTFLEWDYTRFSSVAV